MSTAEITEEHNDVVHDHPSDSKYFQIALILGVLTALEVATYYVDIGPVHIRKKKKYDKEKEKEIKNMEVDR